VVPVDGVLADPGDRPDEAQDLVVAGAERPAGESDEVGEHDRDLDAGAADAAPRGQGLASSSIIAVKVYRRRNGHVFLEPRNPAYDVIDGDRAVVLGVVVSVLRSV
jgi:hypothetical protein